MYAWFYHFPIAQDNILTIEKACQSALGGADYYEHGKTEVWNTTIIVCLPLNV
jgi:hypothetical protein